MSSWLEGSTWTWSQNCPPGQPCPPGCRGLSGPNQTHSGSPQVNPSEYPL